MRLVAFLAILVAAMLAVSCGGNTEQEADEPQIDTSQTKTEVAMAIKVTSPAFEDSAMIPSKYTCDGENISPQIDWSGIPDTAKSIALIADDPDAPRGTWVHWVVYNIPPETAGFAENVPRADTLENGAVHGTTDFGRKGYGGPCPPGGTHRYYFKVYALDTMLEFEGDIDKAMLVQAMEGHVLAEGALMGRYSRQK